MPHSESTQHKLDRVRRPRVHLTYDVEIGGATQLKELPFVVGVLADLSGKPAEPLPRLRDRKFVEIDRDNFNKVLAGTKPRLAFQVENTLQKDGSKVNVELKFNHIRDFEPEQVVRQIEPLRQLLAARERLADLLSKMDGNDKLEQVLQDVISSTEALKKLSRETGRAPSESSAPITTEPEPTPRGALIHEYRSRTQQSVRRRSDEDGGHQPPGSSDLPGPTGPRRGTARRWRRTLSESSSIRS